jgi:hypothetical protein
MVPALPCGDINAATGAFHPLFCDRSERLWE